MTVVPLRHGRERDYMPRPGLSTRPALTHLMLLMTADATFARRLLREPLITATAHPHYPVHLDAQDRATLQSICSCSQNVDEMLKNLADVIDGNPA